jgi:hypothetical protein
MSKHTAKTTTKEIEERFLLHALQRLRTPEQRYVFTLMADLISVGLASAAEKKTAP